MAIERFSSNVPMDAASLVVVERGDWQAKPPQRVEPLRVKAVENVVMVTTNTEPCSTKEECCWRLREIQDQDLKDGLPDIQYNFLVADDGNIYEGRGWNVSTKVGKTEGEKFAELEGKCLYVGFIGPHDMNPSGEMLTAMSGLSSYGVENSFIGRDVKLMKIEGEHVQEFKINVDDTLSDPNDQFRTKIPSEHRYHQEIVSG